MLRSERYLQTAQSAFADRAHGIANLAPGLNPDLALLYEKEAQKGNRNRATVAMACKLVAYLLAVDRSEKIFVMNYNHSNATA
ncbi:MAG: hypothetical protein ACR2IV_05165 [Bryobacteraceae bacterium]